MFLYWAVLNITLHERHIWPFLAYFENLIKARDCFHLLLAARCYKFIWPILKTHPGHSVKQMSVLVSIGCNAVIKTGMFYMLTCEYTL